jgi:excisionase family DNA binding protein
MSKTIGGLVSIRIAAEILGCGVSTLRTWDNNGSLKAVRTPGGQRRYRMEDLERFQREGAAPKAKTP